jgi:hypothetical protein
MKNGIKLIGIIAFVAVIGLLLASCGKKGGTVEFDNSGVNQATIVIVGFGDSATAAAADLVTKTTNNTTKSVAAGEKNVEVGSTDKDGNYAASWSGGKVGTKTGTIKGDETVTLGQ